jgi:RNA polymerase sigma-70 factor (ECF subfamily)
LNASQLVDHLFRREAGRIVSTLTRILGPRNIELAEDAVQDALIRALELWPFRGIPESPSAWLIQVAKNRALDRIRREANLAAKLSGALAAFEAPTSAAPFPDDEVVMLFLCAHPALPAESRLALTLKTVGGFSVGEIARGLLGEEAATAQRIVRAKRQIGEQDLSFEMPGDSELSTRLESVLAVLYLMFNEGYGALRDDLCQEAIRMARMIAENAVTALPSTHALLSLFLLQSSRSAARLDPTGALLLLSDQDRTLWDRARISEGLRYLDRSATGDSISQYHFEAGIAAAHAVSPDADSTDWRGIVDLYEDLYELNPSPVIALNRAVALSRTQGPRAGLEALRPLEQLPKLQRYYLLHAALGSLWRDLGEHEKSRECFRRALECPCSDPERKFLERQ